MNRRAIMLAVASLVVLVPALDAAARGYGRYSNTPPMTPFGPQYDPATYRQAGGDPALYEQLMLQKMAMMQYKQQQAYMKQWEQYKKQMEKEKKDGKKPTTGTTDPNSNPFAQVPPFPNAAARKKKTTTKKTTAKATGTADTKPTDKSKTDSSSKSTSRSTTKPSSASSKTAASATSSSSK